MKLVFRRFRQICCTYKSLRCLDFQIWPFWWWRTDGRTDRRTDRTDCFTPCCACVRGVNIKDPWPEPGWDYLESTHLHTLRVGRDDHGLTCEKYHIARTLNFVWPFGAISFYNSKDTKINTLQAYHFCKTVIRDSSFEAVLLTSGRWPR